MGRRIAFCILVFMLIATHLIWFLTTHNLARN